MGSTRRYHLLLLLLTSSYFLLPTAWRPQIQDLCWARRPPDCGNAPPVAANPRGQKQHSGYQSFRNSSYFIIPSFKFSSFTLSLSTFDQLPERSCTFVHASPACSQACVPYSAASACQFPVPMAIRCRSFVEKRAGLQYSRSSLCTGCTVLRLTFPWSPRRRGSGWPALPPRLLLLFFSC